MNFLAHCTLASAHDDLMVGGFLGDFVKGRVPDELPELIGRGVRLHRRIDAFSNTQPQIRASVERLPAEFRRLAPPFIDLLADHFLAADFERLHGEDLEAFTQRFYAALRNRDALLKGHARRYFEYIQATQSFARYRSVDAVEQAFSRIAVRLGRPEAVAPMMLRVGERYEALRADFERYYPHLADHASAWIADNS